MLYEHKPVMLEECITSLNIDKDGIYIDGTLGGAGHSAEIIKRLDKGTLIGIDQDSNAIKVSEERLSRVRKNAGLVLIKGNFRNMADLVRQRGFDKVDGILLDIGVSSHQLDEAERGFSYQQDAPLDMRMDRDNPLDAATIVNTYDEDEIRDIIREYGEEKWAARIASFIAAARSRNRIETTGQLAEIIKAAIPAKARRNGPHPAKRTFQALRIAVNDELGALKDAVESAVSLLKPGGRLTIITFHSLEDRIVKTEFQKRENPCVCPPSFPVCVCGRKPELKVLTRKPVLPSKDEVERNPRARSAKMRTAVKL
ncbi:MAG TPA: 16S rRNA (cytosine(1402)-N(4))-methyltransferase RsmH [Clostridiales bacterium]|nr:16S rRNA (cytosine(1402)-N(4))-methyltransferase RsmH [Clostridiales bacterium]HOL92087.1 16S rRNA (cytosine(1402)-N(4))-methyltransferase RsmH [Clostridiales bacterium]HPP35994.1 16S rRNA (cytosine(1402)-N(4))-methyltransferase RsmH [Clostridiales bacterium]